MDAQTASSTPLWPLVFYFFLVCFVAAAILFLTTVLGSRHQAPAKGEPFEAGIVHIGSARLHYSVKYYQIAMFFVVFDLEAVFLFAWAVSLRQSGWTGYAEALVFIAILVATLVYLWRQGALDWRPTGRSRDGKLQE